MASKEVEKDRKAHATKCNCADRQPKGVRLYKHPDTGEYQDPRFGTVGCPVGPTGIEAPFEEKTMNESEVAELPLEPSPEKPASERGVVLTNEERLEAENAQLKIMLLMRSKDELFQELQAKVAKIQEGLNEQRRNVISLQETLTAKYRIDFTKEAIEPVTGRIIKAPKKD